MQTRQMNSELSQSLQASSQSIIVVGNFVVQHLVPETAGVLHSSVKIVEKGLDLALHHGGGVNFV